LELLEEFGSGAVNGSSKHGAFTSAVSTPVRESR